MPIEPLRGDGVHWGAGDRDRIALGWGPESPDSIRRVKPLRNYPLVWRKKRQRVSTGMLAERAVRSARNADGWAADGPRQSANAQVQSALFRCSAAP